MLLKVDKSVQKNITRDSFATIKWLSYVTGDSYVEIMSGACLEPVVEDGDSIKSIEPINYTAALENSLSTVESFSKIFKKLEEGGFAESLNKISASLNESINAFQKRRRITLFPYVRPERQTTHGKSDRKSVV